MSSSLCSESHESITPKNLKMLQMWQAGKPELELIPTFLPKDFLLVCAPITNYNNAMAPFRTSSLCTCVQCPQIRRRWHETPRTGVRMLENEPGSSGTAVSALNHGGISPACDIMALLETSLWGLLWHKFYSYSRDSIPSKNNFLKLNVKLFKSILLAEKWGVN